MPVAEFRRVLDEAVEGYAELEGRDVLRRIRRGGVSRIDAYAQLMSEISHDEFGAAWLRRAWVRRWDLEGTEPLPRPLRGRTLAAACHTMGEWTDFTPPRDRRAARKWWERAVRLGDGEAANFLGEAWRDGEGGRKDLREAVRWFRRGARAGNGSAALSLGFTLFYGAGVRRDRRAALRWYRLAATSRDVLAARYALANLGRMYRKGEGVRKSWPTALAYFRRAARHGSRDAEHFLGRYYAGMEGAPERPRVAVRWLERAAARGDAQSQTTLGTYFHNGKHVPRDRRRSVSLYRAAARGGDAWAMHLLGLCHRDGEGVRRNAGLARHWFERAAARGVRAAKRALAASAPRA